MLTLTHTALSPWICIHTDHKKVARINLLQHFLRTVGPPRLAAKVKHQDEKIAYEFEVDALSDGRLEP